MSFVLITLVINSLLLIHVRHAKQVQSDVRPTITDTVYSPQVYCFSDQDLGYLQEQ